MCAGQARGESPGSLLGRQILRSFPRFPESESENRAWYLFFSNPRGHSKHHEPGYILADDLCHSVIYQKKRSFTWSRRGTGVVLLVSPQEDVRLRRTARPSADEGLAAGMALGPVAHLRLCPRCGTWAIPHWAMPAGLSWVKRPSWRSPRGCQAPTVYKWLQSLVLGPASPVALSASF